MIPSEDKPRISKETVIEKVTARHLPEWDAYVERNDEATFFHKGGWYRVIEDSFGHKPHYLMARDSTGTTTGILPLFEIKSLLFGHSLVSTPFCVYGGAVADTCNIRRDLEDAAAELAQALSVDYLEIRYKDKMRDDWPSRSIHSTFLREIAEGSEEILLSIKNKQRAVVRKSVKIGPKREVQSKVDDFFHAYSTSVRNLGTPVFAKRYFENLKNEFGDDCEIVSIRNGDELHCSLISFYFRDQVLPYYGGGLPVSRQSKAMDFMYFDLMCRASDEGYKIFDFGRSKNDSGPYNYKRHWGFEPQSLHYQYFLVNSDKLPELNTTNPRYQMVINAWRKMPLAISQTIGPLISKYLG